MPPKASLIPDLKKYFQKVNIIYFLYVHDGL